MSEDKDFEDMPWMQRSNVYELSIRASDKLFTKRMNKRLEVFRNYIAVLKYCHHFPKPGKSLIWLPIKCYHVYRWRKQIGIITPRELHEGSHVMFILRGINSYGHWLRQPDGDYKRVWY